MSLAVIHLASNLFQGVMRHSTDRALFLQKHFLRFLSDLSDEGSGETFCDQQAPTKQEQRSDCQAGAKGIGRPFDSLRLKKFIPEAKTLYGAAPHVELPEMSERQGK